MDFNTKVKLGKTGLQVGRLGISSSFGAPAPAFEEAFEKGCNYFTWGTFIKGQSKEMQIHLWESYLEICFRAWFTASKRGLTEMLAPTAFFIHNWGIISPAAHIRSISLPTIFPSR